MGIRSCLAGSLTLGALLLAPNASAVPVLYEITGEMQGQFLPVSSDAAADLFGVPRASVSTVTANIQVVVDPDAAPVVINDTSVAQEVIYPSAILSSRIEINGAVFETTRMPAAGTQENEIALTNVVNPAGTDAIILSTTNVGGDLWTSQTVPFGQTINGVLVDDAVITIATLLLPFAGIGTGWLDDFDLPETTADFDGLTGLTGAIQFAIGLSPSPSQGFLQLTLTDFSIVAGPASVPEPGAPWLLGTAVAGALLARRRSLAA